MYNMKKMGANTLAYIVLLAVAFSVASAFDPSPLQDFCVAVNDTNDSGKILMLFLLFLSRHDIFSSMYTDLSKATLVLIYLLLCSVCEWEILQGSKACNAK